MQTKGAHGALHGRTNSVSSSNVGAANNCLNISDNFRSSANKEADMRVSKLLTIKNTINSMTLSQVLALKVY